MLINGKAYAWSDAVFTVASVLVNGISEINYEKKREKTDNYGAGSKPVSRSYGKEEFTADITLHMEEVEAITNAAPDRDLTLIGMFDVTVTFAPSLGAAPVRHMLRGCEFKNNTRAMKEGDNMFAVKLELIVGDIEF